MSDIIAIMASIVIRRLDESLKAKLRLQAAGKGRSMEQEAREILTAGLGLAPGDGVEFVRSIRRLVEPVGGVELRIPKRKPVRAAPVFE